MRRLITKVQDLHLGTVVALTVLIGSLTYLTALGIDSWGLCEDTGGSHLEASHDEPSSAQELFTIEVNFSFSINGGSNGTSDAATSDGSTGKR